MNREPVEYCLGTLSLQIHISESRSLKDKRQIIRSLKDRLRKRYNISIAEVAWQESLKDATVVIATVATDTHIAQQTVDRIHNDAVEVLGRDLLHAESEFSSC